MFPSGSKPRIGWSDIPPTPIQIGFVGICSYASKYPSFTFGVRFQKYEKRFPEEGISPLHSAVFCGRLRALKWCALALDGCWSIPHFGEETCTKCVATPLQSEWPVVSHYSETPPPVAVFVASVSTRRKCFQTHARRPVFFFVIHHKNPTHHRFQSQSLSPKKLCPYLPPKSPAIKMAGLWVSHRFRMDKRKRV